MVTGVFTIPLGAGQTGPELRCGQSLPLSSRLRDFVGGPENALARVVVHNFLQADTNYNPLVLYGPTGTGKTLLALGLADRWRLRHPGTRVVVTTGANFALDYATSLKTDTLADMRIRHRDISLLVVDDLPQLVRKRPAQEELTRTLDAVLGRQGRVIATSRHGPAEMTKLDQALVSRLSAGLALPLLAPGPDARLVILRRLAELHNIVLPETAVLILANGMAATAGQLHGALGQLAAAAGTSTRSINVEQVRRYVAEHAVCEQATLRAICTLVSRYFQVTIGQLKSQTRQRAIVEARSMAMYLARRLTDKSLQQIGRHFGGRDHTTVIHACRKMEKLICTDTATCQAIEDMKNLLITMQH